MAMKAAYDGGGYPPAIDGQAHASPLDLDLLPDLDPATRSLPSTKF